MAKQPDFFVAFQGTIVTLEPRSKRAREWIEENLDKDRQTWGEVVAIGHRYALPILEGLTNDGLTVRKL